MADPGCTTARALSNSGGKLDDAFTTIGLVLLVLAGFFLAHAMRRLPSWQAWAWPARATAVLLLAFGAAAAVSSGLSGLFERLFAAAAAAAVAALAAGILRRSRDVGGPEPGHADRAASATIVGGDAVRATAPGRTTSAGRASGRRVSAGPRREGWTPARIFSVAIGAVLALGLLGAGGAAVWAQTAKGPGGYLDLGTRTYTTGGYAVATDKAELQMFPWDGVSALFGTVRLRATQARGTAPVFIGIAPAAAAAHYLAGVSYSSVRRAIVTRPVYAAHRGGPPAVPPGRAGIWAARAAGPGPQMLAWPVKSGTWTVVAMNADGSRPVSLRVTVAATCRRCRGWPSAFWPAASWSAPHWSWSRSAGCRGQATGDDGADAIVAYAVSAPGGPTGTSADRDSEVPC